MSASRRQSSGEDNILARLERDGKRGTSGQSWKHINTTLAWCGLASLAVIGLVAVLASLAKQNVAVQNKPILVEAKASLDRYADVDRRNGFAPLPAIGAPPRKKAVVIVDEPVARSILPSVEASHAPPMVMLKPAAAAAAKPAPAAPAKPAAATPAKSAAAVAPKPAAAGPAKPGPARIVRARPAAKSWSPKPAPVKVAIAPAPRVLAAVPARPKKEVPAAAAARPEPSAIDSDVALLSAIIMHASRHAAERAQMEAQTCPLGKKCPAPKATD